MNNDNILQLGNSKLSKRQQVWFPDNVIKELNLKPENPILFLKNKKTNDIIIKRGKVVVDV